MRMTKKITSIVLAVLMVVSMMSVMAVSASAMDYVDSLVLLEELSAGDTLSATSGEYLPIKCAQSSVIIKGGTYRERLNTETRADDTELQAEQIDDMIITRDEYGPLLTVMTDSANLQCYPLDAEGNPSDKWYVLSNENNIVTLAGHVPATATYVAQIGETKYESLEEAFAAAVDGDTITLLADCAGNGIKVTPAGKFATGLTVDFDGHTYTVDGETVGSPGTETLAFQLLKNNKVTFKNGTLYSEKAKMLVQNYCDLTLDNMTLTLNNTSYNGAYTLSNNNGNTVIKDTTINANPTTGSFAFDVCRYSSYPSVNVTVTGDSEINGNVEVYASKGQAKDGFSLTLESGTMNGDIVVDATAEDLIGDDNTITKADTFTQTAPEGFKWVDNGDGTSSLAEIVYVAQIGETKYETLEAAFAAAVDGDTIKVLADCAGNGIKVTPAGKFATGLTVDFDGHTYTVDGETVGSPGTETLAFQLLKDNKVTFKDGTIYSEKAKMLVQNYCDLTLDNMTLTLNNTSYNGAYTLSNNNGNTVIKDTTINANPTTGSFAFDVCRYSSYPSVDVTVTGDSVINGNVEVYASKSQAKDGFSLTLESGTMTGDIILDKTAQNVIAATPEKAEVTKKNTFSQEAPLGYEWKDNGDGTSSIITAVSNPLNPIEKVASDINDGNLFGISSDYLKGTLLGVQKKFTDKIDETTSSQEGAKNMRFIAVLDTQLIQDMQGADDYGFVLAKANNTNKTYADINYDAVKAGDDRVKTISAKGTSNNVCGIGDYSAYGDPTNTTTDYKYITCAVNNVTDDDKVIARFYYKKGDKTYYAKYAGHNYQYTGCMAAWSDLA